MRFTLLEIVQDILNDISGDEVDSISDTTEATQVANIVRSSYNYLISMHDVEEHKTYFQLESASASSPTLMTIPTDILKVYHIDYDQKHNPGAFSGGVFDGNAFDTTESSLYTGQVQRIDLREFIRRSGLLAWSGTDVEAYTFTADSGDSFEIKYKTDRHPSYYVILEDYNVIFNSMNTDVDGTNLDSNNTWCIGLKEPVFTVSDEFIPDFDTISFNWLMEEAKNACSVKLRQVEDPIASKRARTGLIRSQRNNANKVPGSDYQTKHQNLGRNR